MRRAASILARPMVRAAACAVTVAVLIGADVAGAATVEVTGVAPDRVLTLTSDGSTSALVEFGTTLDGAGSVTVSATEEDVTSLGGCDQTGPTPSISCGPTRDLRKVVFAGGDGPDRLAVIAFGPDVPIEADGGAGDDALSGSQQSDLLSGGAGDDELLGQSGDDRIAGGDGDDDLQGDAGADTIDGGDGSDGLQGDAGVDALDAGAGDDDVDARDAVADTSVSCGAGPDDRLTADNRADPLADAGCEAIAPQFHGFPPVLLKGWGRVGETLEVGGVDVSGTPATFAFQWVACSRRGCFPIEGATGPAYLVQPSNRGNGVALLVTATNAAGTVTETSAPVGPIAAALVLPPPPPPPTLAPPARVVRPPGTLPAVATIRASRKPAVRTRRGVAYLDTGRTAACPAGAPACRVRVVASAGRTSRGRALTAARGTVVVAGGRARRVEVRLTKAGAAALRERRRLRLSLVLTATRGRARAVRVVAAVTVRAPARRSGRSTSAGAFELTRRQV